MTQKRYYTAKVVIEDVIDDIGKSNFPIPLDQIIEGVENTNYPGLAGLTVVVIKDSFKPLENAPKEFTKIKKKTEGQLTAARRKSGKMAADGPSKDFTVSTPIKRFSRKTSDES